MKVQSYTPVEENTIGEFKDIQSGIRAEDLGFALNAVSKNLYSNPIGSFIRELVSNAVDANTENNSDKPVLVRIFKEDSLWYFSVKDYGKGLNEETFAGVYMNWFNSSKRDNNDLIGGWGLGSKTPLSYVDSYDFITISEGIEYHYSIYKSAKVPVATLINQMPTEQPSGTLVKFEIKEDDIWKIHTESKIQLLYFPNVFVQNYKYFYDNDFNIIETDTFRYRTNNTNFTQLHISLGNVPYKIDFKLLDRAIINLPLAIKFNIGDLPVTLSRESINYEDDNVNVIEIINKKIDLVLEDIQERYNKQRIIDNFSEYYESLYSDRNTLKLADYTLTLEKTLFKDMKSKLIVNGVDMSFNKDKINSLKTIIYSTGMIGSNKSFLSTSFHDISPYKNIIKDIRDNKYSNHFYKKYSYIKIASFNSEILLEIADQLGLVNKEEKKPNWMYISKFYYNNLVEYIKDKVPERYSYYPDWVKEELDNKEKINKTTITYYNAANNRCELTPEDIEKLKILFYIIKDDNTDWNKVGNYQALFKTFPDYYKNNFKVIVLSKTIVNKFKKSKKFMPIESIWRYKYLYNHFNRLRITYEFEELGLTYDINKVSKYYYKLYQDLRNTYKYNLDNSEYIYNKYDKTGVLKELNIYNYFKEQLLSKKNDKHYEYYEYIEELKKVQVFLKTYLFLINKGAIPDIVKYVIQKSKLTKLNR